MVRTQVLKHLPGARKGKSRWSKGDVRRGVTARGAMEKGGCVRVIEGEEVKRRWPSRIEGKKESVLPSVGEEQIGGAYTLRNDTEEELLIEMLIPT